jgi:hypothetical protein
MQNKETDYGNQDTNQKTKDWATNTCNPIKTGDDLRFSRIVQISCTSSDIIHGTVTAHELTPTFLWSSCCSIVSFLYSVFVDQ